MFENINLQYVELFLLFFIMWGVNPKASKVISHILVFTILFYGTFFTHDFQWFFWLLIIDVFIVMFHIYLTYDSLKFKYFELLKKKI